MPSDIVSGGIFPDYELPDHTGTLRKLSRPFHMFGHVFLKLLCLQDGPACAAFD
jgi:hypothetical protein